MKLTLNINKNQLQQLKKALLMLEREKDLFEDENLHNLINQVFREGLNE